VIGNADYTFGAGADGSMLTVGPSTTAQYFLSAADTGYYDLGLSYASPNGASPLDVTLNGRPITGLGSPRAGSWQASARVHLAAGISELDVTSSGTAALDTVTLTRATDGDAATRTIQAEDGTVAGAAQVTSIAASTGSNVQGGAEVTYVGGGAANTLTIARPSSTPAGAYDLDVRYANADQNAASHYNTDVVSRGLDITEVGGATAHANFRHNYSWTSFWTKTVPLDLTTATGDLVLGNATGWAPNLDAVSLSPLVLSTSVVSTSASHGTPPSTDGGTGSTTAKVAATVHAHVKGRVHARKTRARLKISVSAPGITATGRIKVKVGGRKVRATLTNGKATVRLPKLAHVGRQKIKVAYLGDAHVATARTTVRVPVIR
jgi:hypothetical protein